MRYSIMAYIKLVVEQFWFAPTGGKIIDEREDDRKRGEGTNEGPSFHLLIWNNYA